MRTFHWIVVGIVIAMLVGPLLGDSPIWFNEINPDSVRTGETILPQKADTIGPYIRFRSWPTLTAEVHLGLLSGGAGNDTTDVTLQWFTSCDTFGHWGTPQTSDSIFTGCVDTARSYPIASPCPASVWEWLVIINNSTTDSLEGFIVLYPWNKKFTDRY